MVTNQEAYSGENLIAGRLNVLSFAENNVEIAIPAAAKPAAEISSVGIAAVRQAQEVL